MADEWVKLADVQPAMEKAEVAYKEHIAELEAALRKMLTATETSLEDGGRACWLDAVCDARDALGLTKLEKP